MDLTPDETAQAKCALRIIMAEYRISRLSAVPVAAALLVAGWLPRCNHTPRHHFSNYKRHGRNRPIPWYVKPEPDVNDSILFVGSWQPFVAAHLERA